jgi:hypothetical protein
MPCVRFEPTIPASERAKTVHALDRSATVTCSRICLLHRNCFTASAAHLHDAEDTCQSIASVSQANEWTCLQHNLLQPLSKPLSTYHHERAEVLTAVNTYRLLRYDTIKLGREIGETC